MTSTGVDLTGNEAVQYGGGVFVYTGTVSFTGGAFQSNTAIGGGGGVAVYSGHFDASNVGFVLEGDPADNTSGGTASDAYTITEGDTFSFGDAATFSCTASGCS